MKQLITFVLLLFSILHFDGQINCDIVNMSGCRINYVADSRNIQQRTNNNPLPPSAFLQPVNLNTPFQGTGLRAIVFFTVVGTNAATIPFLFNGTIQVADRTGTSPIATCWDGSGFHNTSSYQCEIPIGILVNGNNTIDLLPVSTITPFTDTNGVTLIVIFEENCADYNGRIRIRSELNLNIGSGATTVRNLPFTPSNSIINSEAFMIIGDAETPNNNAQAFGSQGVTFNGACHNFIALPNVIVNGQNSLDFESGAFGGDCTNLSVIGIYYQEESNCATLDALVEEVDEQCAGLCNGSVSISPNSGTPPYDFELLSAGTVIQTMDNTVAHEFVNLCAGTYIVQLTDNNNCEQEYEVVIDAGQEYPNLELTSINTAGCEGCFWSIVATSIHENEAELLFSLFDDHNILITSGFDPSTFTFTDLCSGQYFVSVTNESGCVTSLPIHFESCDSCTGTFNSEPIANPIEDQSCYWSTGGNSNATVGNLNFLGTTDAIPLVIRTNDQERMLVQANGNVGIHTSTPQYDLHNVGSATFSNTNTTTPYPNYNTTNYPVQILTDANQGLAILSNSSNSQYIPHQDRLNIYADDNAGLPITVFETIESHLVFKDRTIGQMTDGISLGINRVKGQVVLKSDWLATGIPAATPNSKLYIESNDVAFSGLPNAIGLFSLNNSTFSSSGRSISIKGESNGLKGNSNTINIGGVFSGSNSYRSVGINAAASGSFNGSVNHANMGGWFQASGGNRNYAVFAQAQGTSGIINEAGHFAGNVVVNGLLQSSDGQLKQEVNDLESAMDIITHLRPVTYTFKRDEFPQMNLPEGKHFGFVSQEVMEIIPEIVMNTAHPIEFSEDGDQTSEEVEFLALNYTEIIPFLTKAIQEQQAEIEELQKALSSCCAEYGYGKSKLNASEGGDQEKPRLEQNAPNPFTQETTIRYFLPESSTHAVISVYALDGSHILDEKLNTTGVGQITISGNILSSGTYVYNLIVDGIQIDSKYMTLTK
jgi:hypothetical protein